MRTVLSCKNTANRSICACMQDSPQVVGGRGLGGVCDHISLFGHSIKRNIMGIDSVECRYAEARDLGENNAVCLPLSPS